MHRSRLPLTLVAALAVLLPACDADASKPGPGAAAEEVEAGLSMLDVMIQIQIATDAIEPNLRNAEALEDVALSGQTILAWTEDPVFAEFTDRPRFFGERERFLELQEFMAASTRDVIAGAEGGDLAQLRDGFIRLKQSCIMCHKRYSPAY